MLEIAAGLEAGDLVDDKAAQRPRVADGGVVRGDGDAGVVPEPACRGKRLALEDVEGGGGQDAIVEGGEDVGLGLKAAAADIDQDRAAEFAVAGQLFE